MGREKSLAAAKYILQRQQDKGDTLTPMQLIKLVYVAHGFMLGTHGRPLLDESVQAWQYGPVVPSVYNAVKAYRSRPVDDVAADVELLNPEEKDVLDLVADTYAGYAGVVLSAATHQFGTPWQKTWSLTGKNSSISNDLIEAFYADLLTQPVHTAL